MSRKLFTDCQLATMMQGQGPYGLIANGTLAIKDGRIAWVGAKDALPNDYKNYDHESLGGRVVTPVLIDCHTHIVFGGNRAAEFEMRANGASYEDISRAGGGILSTVKATSAASDAELLGQALHRVDQLAAEGVGVIEIKSGYGLTIEREIRMLKIACEIAKKRPVKIITTWLAAHALPPEYSDNADGYIDDVVLPGLEKAAGLGLVDAVDGFCENIGFTREQIRRVFEKAKTLGLPVKLHAEQLSNLRGAVLATEYNALSADHLEYLAEDDVQHLAKANTVAVLLPGAFYTLKETRTPPIEAFRKHGVDMAVATDCNPGSSPLTSLLLAMNMAMQAFSLTPEEALTGTTRAAAKALGLDDYGVLAPGMLADIAVWDIKHPSELSYWIGHNPLYRRIGAEELS